MHLHEHTYVLNNICGAGKCTGLYVCWQYAKTGVCKGVVVSFISDLTTLTIFITMDVIVHLAVHVQSSFIRDLHLNKFSADACATSSSTSMKFVIERQQ